MIQMHYRQAPTSAKFVAVDAIPTTSASQRYMMVRDTLTKESTWVLLTSEPVKTREYFI